MAQSDSLPPTAGPEIGRQVLKALARQRSLLPALEIMHAQVGDVFQLTLPRFRPVFTAGPENNRQVLVSERDKFLWRGEKDPVVRLLGHGLLVEDGDDHDRFRRIMEPAFQRTHINGHIQAMCRYTDQVLAGWKDDQVKDMLVEMRRIALLILMGTMFGTDFAPDMDRLWRPILKAIKFISPGPWIIWPDIPRPGYKKALGELDQYIYELIAWRRRHSANRAPDLLSKLIDGDLDDGLIRDQILTMLIAGHDTSTALLSWTLYLLGLYPEAMAKAQDEVDEVVGGALPAADELGKLLYLDQVIKESLRLYPPIHVGNRFTESSLQIQGYHVPANTRVMYSIYLTHRDPKHWPEPDKFIPERFDRSQKQERPALAYVPFGGGPRNCIGATFAQIEAKVILARILQANDLQLLSHRVRPYMGATLEPSPELLMKVTPRRTEHA